MDDLSTTTGIVAVCAAAIALLSLGLAASCALRLRRLRAAQRIVLDGRGRNLVGLAADFQRAFEALNGYVTEVATRLDERLAQAERRLDGTVAHTGLVRYDAYNEMSGRQSTSIALLDSRGTGIVLSSIHHRDQARLYAKQVVDGRGQLELSPEEGEAVRVALAGEVPDAAERAR